MISDLNSISSDEISDIAAGSKILIKLYKYQAPVFDVSCKTISFETSHYTPDTLLVCILDK